MKPLWRDTYNVLGSNGCTKQYNVVVAGQEMGDTTGGYVTGLDGFPSKAQRAT